MARPIVIPNVFQNQTGNIPLSQLDTDFSTIATAVNDPASYANYAVDSGAVNAYIITLNPAPSSLASMTGVPITFKPLVTNTGASTINVNGFGAINIVNTDSSALLAGEIVAGNIFQLSYNGTNFILMSVTGTTTGAVSAIQPVTATVAASALTVGINASSLQFRSATLTTGVPIASTAFSALSLVVPSTATLGTVSAVQSQLVLVVLYNAGVPALGIVNISGGTNLDETTLLSTTAMTTGATSASVVYSSSAITSSPFRVVGTVVSTQATAGTWATTPSLVQGYGGQAMASMQSLGFGQTWQTVTRTAGTTYYNTTAKPITYSASLVWSGAGTGCYRTVSINGGGGIYVSASGQIATSGVVVAVGQIIIPPSASYVFTDINVTSVNSTELR